jgi:hypothetical protein
MTAQDVRSTDLERLAERVRWPQDAVGTLLHELTSALRHLRTRHAGKSEQVLAGRWRAGNPRVDLDDPVAFLMVGRALLYHCRLLHDQEAARRRAALDELVDKARSSAIGLSGFGRSFVTEEMQEIFTGLGTPLPAITPIASGPADEVVHALFDVVKLVKGVHEDMGSPHLDDDTTADLVVLSVASHALNAPDEVWPLVEPPPRVSAGAPAEASGADPDDVDPMTLAERIVGRHVVLHRRLTAATQHADALRLASPAVVEGLRAGRVGDEVLAGLRLAGLQGEQARKLAVATHEYERARWWTRPLDDPRPGLRTACSELLERWGAAVEEAGEVAAEARQALERQLDAFVPAVRRSQPGPDSALLPHAFPQSGYIGQAISTDPRYAHLVHSLRWLMDVDVVPGRPWARLPRIDLCETNLVLVTDERSLTYAAACRALQGIALDQMAKAAPGRLRITWLDPTGQGQSAGPLLELLELDKEILDGKVWSEPEDIEHALRRTTDRMAELEQRCLRDTFDHLADYNRQAGQLGEPYHLLVVAGFPRGLTEAAAQRLRHITESGGRLGITVVAALHPSMASLSRTVDHDVPGYARFQEGTEPPGLPHWWNPGLMPQASYVVGHAGRPHVAISLPDDEKVWVPCWLPATEPAVARSVVRGYAAASAQAQDVVVDSEQLLAASDSGEVSRSSAQSVDIPIGVRGRGTPVELSLGRGLAQNVLVGGRPGSGKSQLLHTLIINAVRRYGPDELELYLLDFKQGVEFVPYATGALPHATVVAVESERDFGLSVLRDLRGEIDRRAEFLRGRGAESMAEFRQRGGAGMRRVLLVIDEFQVLFADDDRIAHESAQLLDHVVRQGRAFGIHAVLGTQSLRGHGAMALLRSTLDLVAVRIVLATSETDSRLFLADDNPAGARLTRPGEAIFNTDGGSPPGNVAFQVALTSEAVRDGTIAAARAAADRAGFTRRPRVFDGSRAIGVVDDEEVAALLHGERPARPRTRFHVGLPVAVGGSGGVDLTRRGGRHVAVVHRDGALAAGMLVIGLVTAIRSAARPPKVTVVDCLGVDEDGAEVLTEAAGGLPGVRVLRGRRLRTVLADAAAEARRRLDDDDHVAAQHVVVVSALHRARDLQDDGGFDGEGSPLDDLRTILRDGADVGVHVVVVADSVETLERRVGHAGLAEFGVRVVGQCSVDASHKILGSPAAARLGPRYALLYEPDDDRLETVRPFPLPEPDWLATASGAAR